MALETIVAALGGALIGGIVTGASNWYITKQMIDAENERRRADYLLQKEADALMAVYESLQEARRAIGRVRNAPPNGTIKFETEIKPAHERYWKAFKQALIFLSEDERRVLKETWVDFSTKIDVMENMDEINPEHEALDWSEFTDTIENAEEMLETVINEPIREFESN